MLIRTGGLCSLLYHTNWVGGGCRTRWDGPLCTGSAQGGSLLSDLNLTAITQPDHSETRRGSTAALGHLSGSTSAHTRSRTPRGRAGRSRTPPAAPACPQQRLPGPFPLSAEQQRCKTGNSLTCSSWEGGMVRDEQRRSLQAADSKDDESITHSSLGARHLLPPQPPQLLLSPPVPGLDREGQVRREK